MAPLWRAYALLGGGFPLTSTSESVALNDYELTASPQQATPSWQVLQPWYASLDSWTSLHVGGKWQPLQRTGALESDLSHFRGLVGLTATNIGTQARYSEAVKRMQCCSEPGVQSDWFGKYHACMVLEHKSCGVPSEQLTDLMKSNGVLPKV